MSDIAKIDFMPEAAAEVKKLPADRRAWIQDKIRHVREVGWQESFTLKLIKKLGGEIYEIRVNGRGASYRLLCFQAGGVGGRLVVVASCAAKGDMLGRELKQQVKRAETRRQQWLRLQQEKEKNG